MTPEQLETYLIKVQAATVILDEAVMRVEVKCDRLSTRLGALETINAAQALQIARLEFESGLSSALIAGLETEIDNSKMAQMISAAAAASAKKT